MRTPSPPRNRNERNAEPAPQAAFTLLEIAAVLVVVGLIVAAVFPRMIKEMRRDTVKQEKTSLRAAREEVIGQIIDNDCEMPASYDLGHIAGKYGTSIYVRNASAPFGSNLSGVSGTGWDAVLTPSGDTVDDVVFYVWTPGKNGVDDFNTYTDDEGDSVNDLSGTLTLPAFDPDNVDDVIDYATLSRFAGLCENATSTTDPTLGDVNFATGMSGFESPLSEASDAAHNVFVADSADNELVGTINEYPHSGYPEHGCIWYQGTSSPYCTDGNCTFGNGIRAYYEYQFKSIGQGYGRNGEGFIFAIVSAENNTIEDCGGIERNCCASYMGYSGPGLVRPPHGLEPPKFGFEFDIEPDTQSTFHCRHDGRNDYAPGYEYDHLAMVFWGQTDVTGGGCYESDARDLQDDNFHGRPSSGDPDEPRNPDNDNGLNEDGSDGYLFWYHWDYDRWPSWQQAPWNEWSVEWMTNGSRYVFRTEVERTPSDADGTQQGNYVFRAWVYDNATAPTGFSDVSTDFDDVTYPPHLTYSVTLSPERHLDMNNIIFGWTTGGRTDSQIFDIKDFRLSFR